MYRRFPSGQTLIEVLVALTIGTIVITGITSSVLYSIINSRVADNKSKINHYLQEGMEVARLYRSRPVGTYCLDKNQASLKDPNATCTDLNIDDKYKRTVRIIGSDPSCQGNNKLIVKLEYPGEKCEKNSSGLCEESLESCANVELASGAITSTPTVIPSPSGPYVQFLAPLENYKPVHINSNYRIEWVSKYVNNCILSGEPSGNISVSEVGSRNITPFTQVGESRVYKITCKVASNPSQQVTTQLKTIVGATDVTPTTTLTPSPTGGQSSSIPYGGTPRTIPGTLQAEDFDTGGEGLAYHDTTSGNSGDSTYRNYNVDLYDRDGGVIVGSIADGEWLLFTTNITGGTYDINFRTAASTEGRSMRILINGQLLKTIDIPSTGSTGNYQSFTIPRVSISGGNNKLVKLEFVGGNFSFNWISFTTSLSTPIFLKNVNPGGNGITLRDGPAGTSIGRSFDLGHVGRQLSGPVRAILPSNNTSYDWYQIDSSYDPVGWAANSLTQTWLAPETFPKTLTFFSGISGSPPLYYTSGCDYETQGDTCRRDTLVIARQDIYLNKIACNNCGAKEWVVYESNSSFSNSKLLATGTTLTTSGNWKEATLTTPLKLSKGTYYIIGFSIDVGNSTFRNFDGYNGDTFPDFNYVDPLKLRVGTSGSGYADLGAFDIRVTVDNE